MAGLVALAWAKSGLALLAPAAALLSLIVLMAWREAAFHEFAMDESGLWTSLLGGDAPQFLRWMLAAALAFTLAGLAGLRLRTPAVIWSALAAGSALLFVFFAWARVDALLDGNVWALLGAGFALTLLAAMGDQARWFAGGIRRRRRRIAFTLDRLFDGVWLTLAIAVARRLCLFHPSDRRPPLGPIAVALASSLALRLFMSRELWFDDRTCRSPALGDLWLWRSSPAFPGASRWLKRKQLIRETMSLEGLSPAWRCRWCRWNCAS
jgi:hypothetical protein